MADTANALELVRKLLEKMDMEVYDYTPLEGQDNERGLHVRAAQFHQSFVFIREESNVLIMEYGVHSTRKLNGGLARGVLRFPYNKDSVEEIANTVASVAKLLV